MIRPNFIGNKVDYLNIGTTVSPTSANIAALDSSWGTETIYPYAASATVRENYDALNIYAHGQDFVFTNKAAFGVFLTPDNEKGNLLFQFSGCMTVQSLSNSANFHPYFFFGRKATNNTVVSDLTSQNNALDKYIILPTQITNGTSANMTISCNTEIIGAYQSGGYNWCAGIVFSCGGAANVTFYNLKATVMLRKYQSEIGVYRPSR